MSDKEWVKAAMADDSMVVELLVRLNQASPPKRDSPALPLDWSVRQRRSKPMMLQANKLTARSSPTTPLSWSGATSLSGGGGGAADGLEESSRASPKRSDISRSKVAGTSETTIKKRSRKKKTLAELKENEVVLLKERRHLKKELATLRITLEKQRSTNECLKRMKLDLLSQPAAGRVTTVAPEEAISDRTQEKLAASEVVSPILPPSVTGEEPGASLMPSPPNSCFELQKEITDQETKFVLPDLNIPFEQDSSRYEVLCGKIDQE